MNTLQAIENEQLRRDLPPFRAGDTVRVHVKIREGDKERIQIFEGVVIRRHGAGKSATFTVRKVSYGVGVERIFPVEGSAVQKVEIQSRGFVRRSRLYYLRDLSGKKARLRSKVRDVSDLISEEERDARSADEEAAGATKKGKKKGKAARAKKKAEKGETGVTKKARKAAAKKKKAAKKKAAKKKSSTKKKATKKAAAAKKEAE